MKAKLDQFLANRGWSKNHTKTLNQFKTENKLQTYWWTERLIVEILKHSDWGLLDPLCFKNKIKNWQDLSSMSWRYGTSGELPWLPIIVNGFISSPAQGWWVCRYVNNNVSKIQEKSLYNSFAWMNEFFHLRNIVKYIARKCWICQAKKSNVIRNITVRN